MKKLATLILIISISFFLFAQEDVLDLPVDEDTKKIKFREVVDEQGTKDQLFNRCIYWLNQFYKDPTRVTSIRDVPTGKIEGHHQFRIYYYEGDSVKRAAGMVKYTFVIDLKDQKYRYTIDELLLKSKTNVGVEKWMDKDDPAYDPRWDDYLRQIADYMNDWSSSLKEKMKPEPEKKEDDW